MSPAASSQGCLSPVRIVVPESSILHPSLDAGVVGGNVLTSQRVVDVIFRAFEVCAASQVRGAQKGQGGGPTASPPGHWWSRADASWVRKFFGSVTESGKVQRPWLVAVPPWEALGSASTISESKCLLAPKRGLPSPPRHVGRASTAGRRAHLPSPSPSSRAV